MEKLKFFFFEENRSGHDVERMRFCEYGLDTGRTLIFAARTAADAETILTENFHTENLPAELRPVECDGSLLYDVCNYVGVRAITAYRGLLK